MFFRIGHTLVATSLSGLASYIFNNLHPNKTQKMRAHLPTKYPEALMIELGDMSLSPGVWSLRRTTAGAFKKRTSVDANLDI